MEGNGYITTVVLGGGQKVVYGTDNENPPTIAEAQVYLNSQWGNPETQGEKSYSKVYSVVGTVPADGFPYLI